MSPVKPDRSVRLCVAASALALIACAGQACYTDRSPPGELGEFVGGRAEKRARKSAESDSGTSVDSGKSLDSVAAADSGAAADAGSPVDASAPIDPQSTDPQPSTTKNPPVDPPKVTQPQQPSTPAKSEWTMLGYDLASTYYNSAERVLTKANVGTLRERFVVEMGAAVYGAPLIAEGKVFVNAGKRVMALDAASGELIWLFELAEPDDSSINTMAYDAGRLFLHSLDADVFALNAADGSLIWGFHRETNEPYDMGYSSPIVAGDLVLLGRSSNGELLGGEGLNFQGSLIARNKHDGALVWRSYTVPEGANGVGIWSTPSVDLDVGQVFVSTGNNYTKPASETANAFMAFELKTGAFYLAAQQRPDVASLPETGSAGQEFGANPVLYEAVVFGKPTKLLAAGAKSGRVHVIERVNGRLIWMRELGPGSDSGYLGVLNNTTWSGKNLLVALNTGETAATATLFALDGATGDLIWQMELAGDVLGRITVANGVGFVGAGTTLHVFDVESGKLFQSIDMRGATAAGVASIADGLVAVGTGADWLDNHTADKGQLIVFEVER